jgi:hypothetical protein
MPGSVGAFGHAAEYEVAPDKADDASLAETLRQESLVARPYQPWPDQARAVCGVSAAMTAKAENMVCSIPMSFPKCINSH